jgi:shikimate kinase
MRILLIGFMGAGKSSVGRILARLSGFRFVDLDARIEAEEGLDVRAIFQKHGEPYFRRKEARALQAVLQEDGVVIASGGGVVTSEEARALIEPLPYTVYLEASFDTIKARLLNDTKRPLWRSHARANELYLQRTPLYEALAKYRVTTDGLAPREVALEILNIIGLTRKNGNHAH